MIEKLTNLIPNFKYGWVILLFIPILIFLILFIRSTWIKFKKPEELKQYTKNRKFIRIFVIITRALIFLFLLIALATPILFEEKSVPGEASVTILMDNSKSFELFDSSIAPELTKQLKNHLPVNEFTILEPLKSDIGDSILNNLKGNDNILLISDGNNNLGKDLGDIVFFARNINSSISTLDMTPIKDDTSVVIDGTSNAILGSDAVIDIYVNQVGKRHDYKIKVAIDGKTVLDEKASGSETFNIKKQLSQGYHEVKAELIIPKENDYFEENNVYYKTVNYIPKPKVLIWSKKSTNGIIAIAKKIYNTDVQSSLPSNLDKHHAIVMMDKKASDINENDYDKLYNFVSDGGGLIVVGGENSFDRGDYKGSLIETLLPTKTGEVEEEESKEVNIVIVIDISESTGIAFSQTKKVGTKVDVEKALAISILEDIKKDNKVGVVVFNHEDFVISPLSELGSKPGLKDKIARLQFFGATNIAKGILRADKMLFGSKGSKNIILISDGVVTIGSNQNAFDVTKQANKRGVKTYAVGVGFDTNELVMKNIAAYGGGAYFRPKESQRLKIIFGEPEEEDKDKMAVQSLDSNHFITEELALNAVLTGYNSVVPKTSAQSLLVTTQGKPVLTVWRFGLGRVVSFTTDDGSKWSGELFSKQNSKIISRMINWVIGDPSKNKAQNVFVKDTTKDEPVNIKVKSNDQPVSEKVEFSKISDNMYEGSFATNKTGFYEFLGAKVAVNYPKEFSKLGLNQELKSIVAASGGEVFSPNEVESIAKRVKANAMRTQTMAVDKSYPFIILAIIILLIELFVRRVWENKVL